MPFAAGRKHVSPPFAQTIRIGQVGKDMDLASLCHVWTANPADAATVTFTAEWKTPIDRVSHTLSADGRSLALVAGVDAPKDRPGSLTIGVAGSSASQELPVLVKNAPRPRLGAQTAEGKQGDAITGTPTGYVDFDELTAGLQPNALVVIGARPAMGKTSFALGMAAHAALASHKPSLIFSLEMSRLEITSRLLSSEARVDAGKMRTGKLSESDWEKLSRAVGPLAEAQMRNAVAMSSVSTPRLAARSRSISTRNSGLSNFRVMSASSRPSRGALWRRCSA